MLERSNVYTPNHNPRFFPSRNAASLYQESAFEGIMHAHHTTDPSFFL